MWLRSKMSSTPNTPGRRRRRQWRKVGALGRGPWRGFAGAQFRFRAGAGLGLAIFFSGSVVALAPAGGLRAADGLCPGEGGTSARVVSVDERLELTSRKRHPAQNRRRRSAASDAGRSRPRLPRAGPARSMARWARNTVSPARTGPGSLGACRCLCLRCRAGVYTGVSKWAGTGAVAGRRGAHRCGPRAL